MPKIPYIIALGAGRRRRRRSMHSDQAAPTDSEDTVQTRAASPTPSVSRNCVHPIQVEAGTSDSKDSSDLLLKEPTLRKSCMKCVQIPVLEAPMSLTQGGDTGWRPWVRRSEPFGVTASDVTRRPPPLISHRMLRPTSIGPWEWLRGFGIEA